MQMRAHVLPAVAILAVPPPARATERVGSLRHFPNAPPDIETVVALGIGVVILLACAGFLVRLIYIRSRTLLADARLALAEKQSQIATVPVPPTARSGSKLSLAEIEQVLEQMPEASLELKTALLRLLELRLQEKF
jgi:hypothetical protein